MSMCPVCNNPIDSQAPVCPHCGFKLLGSTQRFEPVSFGDDALPVAAAPQAAAALHVVRGPQTGVTYQLGDQRAAGLLRRYSAAEKRREPPLFCRVRLRSSCVRRRAVCLCATYLVKENIQHIWQKN